MNLQSYVFWDKKQNNLFSKVTQYGGWKLYCFETKMDAQACNVLYPFNSIAVCPGLVFIEKLQNNDLMMTSFLALRRPNDDHVKVSRMTSSRFALFYHKYSGKQFWILNVQCTWLIQWTNQEISPIFLNVPEWITPSLLVRMPPAQLG